jgi:hypothetical protein
MLPFGGRELPLPAMVNTNYKPPSSVLIQLLSNPFSHPLQGGSTRLNFKLKTNHLRDLLSKETLVINQGK